MLTKLQTPKLSTPEEGSYSIDVSGNLVAFSSGSICSLYKKEDFLSNSTNSIVPTVKLQRNDTIIQSKFADQSNLFICDYEYKIAQYTQKESTQEYDLLKEFYPGNRKKNIFTF